MEFTLDLSSINSTFIDDDFSDSTFVDSSDSTFIYDSSDSRSTDSNNIDDEVDSTFCSVYYLYLWFETALNNLANLTNENNIKLESYNNKSKNKYILKKRKELIYDNFRIATEIYYLLNTYLPEFIENDKYNILETKRTCIEFHKVMYKMYESINKNMEKRQTTEQKKIMKAFIYELNYFDTKTIPKKFKYTRNNNYIYDYQVIEDIINYEVLTKYN